MPEDGMAVGSYDAGGNMLNIASNVAESNGSLPVVGPRLGSIHAGIDDEWRLANDCGDIHPLCPGGGRGGE